MKRVLLLVEGQTEERFVKMVLAPSLPNTLLTPIIVATKRVKSGGKFRGGLGSYRQVRDEVRRLLNDSSASMVTTLFDLYGLPDDFPGIDLSLSGTQRARGIESAMQRDAQDPRYLPHLSVYELETYVFVSPEKVGSFSASEHEALIAVRNQVGGEVEKINDGETTHPAARLKQVRAGYDKVVEGPDALLDIGVGAIAAACPHFNDWFSKLQALQALQA